MIKRIGCIEIPVSNMEKAVSFYETVLGLKKAYEHPVWTSFDVGGTSFALAASGTKPGKEAIKTCSSCSLCVLRFAAGKTKDDRPSTYAVINLEVEDLDEAYKIESKECKVCHGTQEAGLGRQNRDNARPRQQHACAHTDKLALVA